jgi:CHAT domain-containing protein
LAWAIALLWPSSPVALASLPHGVTRLAALPYLSQAPLPESNQGQALERMGQDYYAEGEFRAALAAFQQAAQVYAAGGDSIRQAISLGNVSLAYQQLGQWPEADQAIATALDLVNTALENIPSIAGQSALAQVLDIQGHLQLTQGNAEQALKTWEQSATLYRHINDPERLGTSLLNQGSALRALGLYQRALVILQQALRDNTEAVPLLEELGSSPLAALNQRLQALPKTPVTVNALRSLGDTLQIAGSLEQAQTVLAYSLDLAETLGLPDQIAEAHLSLGNVIQTKAVADLRPYAMAPTEALAFLQPPRDLIDTALARRSLDAAQRFEQQMQLTLQHYQQAATRGSPIQLQAQLSQLKLLLVNQQWEEAEALSSELSQTLATLPPGPTTLEAQLNLAQSLMDMTQPPYKAVVLPNKRREAAELLAKARQQAIALGDSQSESYILGLLGLVYEQNQQFDAAENVTIQALQQVRSTTAPIAQAINDAEYIYRWQWQLGRVHKAQGQQADAIAAYTNAIDTLTQLRKDIVTSNLPYRFAFRDSVEGPIYFELLDLLLEDASPSQDNLDRARSIVSLLNQAELTNFLQEPCETVTPEEADSVVNDVAQTTAIFYPIILGDRLDIILKLPQDRTLFHYRSEISKTELENTIQTLKDDLEEDYTFNRVRTNAQKLYDWIIKPAARELENYPIDTLIFALTGTLQEIPMSVLYDGNQYLIERYAVSEILGLKLDNPAPIQRERLNILAAGLAEIAPSLPEEVRVNFAPLPNVPRELQVIEDSDIPAKTLRDQQFTRQNFNTVINGETFSVAHLATHGQFSSNPQDTFLLTAATGDDNGKIAANDLAVLFRVRGRIQPEPIELLILSACETAVGDNLATLGIAGTAYRAGARSVIATLWTLDDAPTVKFTEQLYKNLGQSNVSKAEALRRAQIELLKDPQFEHPRYWSPYILAGNWL